MKFKEYEAPCGRLLLGVHGDSICLCDWIVGDRIEKTLRRIHRHLPPTSCNDVVPLLEEATLWLNDYFDGRAGEINFSVAALGTEFQRRVWECLCHIPYGKTESYRFIAEAVGMPEGVRAVAAAIAANPVSILIPCHRIIGQDGSLTGYAGGLDAKKYLLRLEKLHCDD